MIKICHLTSVHPTYDIRIFHKECVSLYKAGYDVTLIAPGLNSIENDGVKIEPINLPAGRLGRMMVVTFRMFAKALKTEAKIFHFHDPELMLCGVLLKIFGKKVIFDIHENVRLSFKSKHWLPKATIPFLVSAYYLIERICMLFYDALILAEDSYLKFYPKRKSTVVLNYPLLREIGDTPVQNVKRINLVYTGGILENRGVWEMLNLAKFLNEKGMAFKLTLVGQIWAKELEHDIDRFVVENKLKDKVELTGKVEFTQIHDYLMASDVGLALLKPIANYKESLPTKIFEYMQYGLPVITNDFDLYKKYVEAEDCGICVDILNFDNELAKIERLLHSVDKMKEMGARGKLTVQDKYNWDSQSEKLFEAYKGILR